MTVRTNALTVGVLATAAVALILVAPGTAPAAFPGVNGAIAYNRFEIGADIIAVDPATGRSALVVCDGYYPSWTADGRVLAWRDDALSLFSAQGARMTGFDAGADIRGSVVAPDGTRVAWESGSDIWIANVDGSGRANLTSTVPPPPPATPGGYEFDPAFSPDGKRIAFARGYHDELFARTGEIWTMAIDGSQQRRITEAPPPEPYGTSAIFVTHTRPDWSPDGSRIAFALERATGSQVPQVKQRDIYVVPAAGGMPINLTNGAALNSGPSWSPEGDQIAYERWAGSPQIAVMNADGSGQRLITSGEGGSDPSWGSAKQFGRPSGICADPRPARRRDVFAAPRATRRSASWRITCPQAWEAPNGCRVKLTAHRLPKSHVATPKRAGSVEAKLRAGHTRRITLKLNRATKRIIKRWGWTYLSLSATVHYGAKKMTHSRTVRAGRPPRSD
jgi:hypothetical protein